MSQNYNNQSSKDLHTIFRSQIVQKYPVQNNNHQFRPIFLEDEVMEKKQVDFVESLMRDNQIVNEYMDIELGMGSKRRSILNYDNFQNLMASESDNNQVPSRNSSLSSKDNNLDFNSRSFDKIPFLNKKYSQDIMDIQQQIDKRRSIIEFPIHQSSMRQESSVREKQKSQKINKIQQVGCNCRKSKCLKMYCQCFHLQIFCNQNCNCVDCGNAQPNAGHQQAVIDALARNPKAFQQQKPAIQNSFTLGVQLAEVKKGCKCKKTKCLKKYCQCYNSGTKCGIFCKCEGCQNNN